MLIIAIIGFIGVICVVDRAPRLLGPYLELRSRGHNVLIEQAGVEINQLLQWLDRGQLSPRLEYPQWAVALANRSAIPSVAIVGRIVLVASETNFRVALNEAEPGDVIKLMPGIYNFEGNSLDILRSGRPDMPIEVRAQLPGTVTLNFSLLEGFHVQAPYWRFENLKIIGVCSNHNDCEHAFHVVGNAHDVVIRGNDIRDFNAHIKINGSGVNFPDGGRIEGNQLTNQVPRWTDAPVTFIDLVAASGWHIEGNLIADFVKAGGNLTSYGAFAKGGGSGNSFVRNVVLCEHRLRGLVGQRVGLSFGGGGTSDLSCRDKRCVVEQNGGLIRDNLISSCSDDGIYINRSAQTEILNNTLLDTAGINIRFAESSAFVDGNLLDGPIIARAGAILHQGDNLSAVLGFIYLGLERQRSQFLAKADLDLRWYGAPSLRARGKISSVDLCGTRRNSTTPYGAFENFETCLAFSHR